MHQSLYYSNLYTQEIIWIHINYVFEEITGQDGEKVVFWYKRSKMDNKIITTHFFRWDEVITKNGEVYQFPQPITCLVKEYSNPAVYRWRIIDSEGNEFYYIGETQDLLKRINGYLNPGPSQQTNKRIKASFLENIEVRNKIFLDVLRINQFVLNEVTFSPRNLKDKFFRKMIESMMIVFYASEGKKLLNL
jgi:hypothetical protein